MRILYGVQSTGNGHITRARALSKEFNKVDAHVDYLFSGRPLNAYFQMEQFTNRQTYRGLTFTTVTGEVQYFKSVFDNNLPTFIRDVRSLDLSPYDVIITDFEPITAWAAKLQQKHVIGIGHQYAFRYKIPVKGGNPIARAIFRYFAPVDFAVGLHWHHFNNPILTIC